MSLDLKVVNRAPRALQFAVGAVWAGFLVLSVNAASRRGGLAVIPVATASPAEGSGPWSWEKVQLTDLTWAESWLLRAPTLLPLALLGVIGCVLLIAGRRAAWRAGWWQAARTPVTVLLVAMAFSGFAGAFLAGIVTQAPVEPGPIGIPVELGWLVAAALWYLLSSRRAAVAPPSR